MISRQKREDARIAALIEEEEEEEGEESRDTTVSLSSEPGTPGPYKYEEPSVDDVEREVNLPWDCFRPEFNLTSNRIKIE